MEFDAQVTSNNYFIEPSGVIALKIPRITFTISNGAVTEIEVTEAHAERTTFARDWIWTQAQYNQLTPQQWVIYNIIG